MAQYEWAEHDFDVEYIINYRVGDEKYLVRWQIGRWKEYVGFGSINGRPLCEYVLNTTVIGPGLVEVAWKDTWVPPARLAEYGILCHWRKQSLSGLHGLRDRDQAPAPSTRHKDKRVGVSSQGKSRP